MQRTFDTHARQWRWLDADYMVEPALRDEIAGLTPAADIAAYEIAFTYCIDGRPLRASLYPALPVLFQVQDGIPSGGRLWSDALATLLGPARDPAAALEDRHRDIARSAQVTYENAFFNLLGAMHRATAPTPSYLAGGWRAARSSASPTRRRCASARPRRSRSAR